MTKNATLIILSLLLIVSCKHEEGNYYRFNPATLKEGRLLLSQIADDISYIPLKDINLGLVYNNFQFTDESVFLSVKDIGVLQYSYSGNLLNNIGSVGRGPGQYIFHVFFSIDEKAKHIYVLDENDNIKVYSETGRFLRDIHTSKYGTFVNAFNTYNSRLFLSFSMKEGSSQYKWIIIDSVGNIVKKKERNSPPYKGSIGDNGGTYKFNGCIYYWNLFSDTVFYVNQDFEEKPAFIVSPGSHRLPESKNLSMDKLMEYMKIEKIFESERYRFIKFYYSPEKNCLAIIEKKTGKSNIIYLESQKEGFFYNYTGGIDNDLDNGIAFLPKDYFLQNSKEFLIDLIYPYQIKTHILSEHFKSSVPKYPEKKKELEKLANNLKETDNPVLVLVRLKD